MAQIYDSLQNLISRELISKASKTVEENEVNVSSAVSSILAGFLAVMLKKGDTPQIRNILEEAGNLNIMADKDAICEEKPTREQQKIGDDYLQHLLGDKAADFTSPIAIHASISKVATNRLISIIAPLICGYLGNEMEDNGWNMQQLIVKISIEKNGFKGSIPQDLIRSFGLAMVLDATNATGNDTVKGAKGNGSWIRLIVIIVILLFILYWWRSCRSAPDMVYEQETITITGDSTQNK